MYLAEYLPRLEQISATVDVAENSTITSLALRDSRIHLETVTKNEHVTHAADKGEPSYSGATHYEILLPVADAQLGEAKITKLACRNDVVSLTLSLGLPPSNSAPSPFTALPNTNGIWSVEDLLRKTPRDQNGVNQFQFTCSACNAVVVDSESHKFIDMPSEYWHEMMDFWHCHKPHEAHHDTNDKNYNGKLNPRPGFVHVGTSYILLPKKDDKCVCGTKLGELDGDALKISKWNLHLQYGEITETYPPYSFVYFSILDRVNASGVRKFTLKSSDSASAYNVWVTSVGLDVSFGGKMLKECLKLLYAVQTDSNDDDVLELPKEVWDSLQAYFEENNALLPESRRRVELMDGEVKRHNDVCYLAPQRG